MILSVESINFYILWFTDRHVTLIHVRNSKKKGFNKPVTTRQAEAVPRSLRKLQKSLKITKEKEGSQKGSASGRNRQQSSQQKSNKKRKLHGKQQLANQATVLKPGEQYEFQTTIREGESFKSYCRRIGREKRMVLVGQSQKLTKISEKRKRHLNERKQKEKEKRSGLKQEDDADSADDPRPAHLKNRKKEFDKTEEVKFGEVADAPPLISRFPKKKEVGMNALAEFLRKKQEEAESAGENGDEDEGEDSDEDEEEREERERAEEEYKKQQQKEQLEARMLELMRERSQNAYTALKKRNRVPNTLLHVDANVFG